jgi:two-component system, NarL family, response regulator NreC
MGAVVMKNIGLIIVDDHQLVREGTRFFLSGIPLIEVLGMAATPAETFQLIARSYPDVAMVDLGLPAIETGLGLIEDIKSRYSSMKVLVFTDHVEAIAIHGALAAGADGYVLKSASINEFATAIMAVAEGKKYLSPNISANIVDGFLNPGNGSNSSSSILSRREREVLRLLMESNKNKDIGEILFISPRTVEKHIASLKRKLHCSTIVELAIYCMKNEILS